MKISPATRRLLQVWIVALTPLLSALNATADDRIVVGLVFSVHDYEPLSVGDARASVGHPLVQQHVSGSDYEVVVSQPPIKNAFVIQAYQLDNPPITRPNYAINGRISYQDVDAGAYLELSSHFADGSQSVTRALDDAGPMMKLQGSSAARAFRVASETKPGLIPSRVTLNLVMAGKGTVRIESADIVEDAPPTTAAAIATTEPAATPPTPIALSDLPPAVAVAVRQSMERQFVDGIERRARLEQKLAVTTHGLGPGSREVNGIRAELEAADRSVAALRKSLEASSLEKSQVFPPGRRRPLTSWALIGVIGGHVGIIVGALWVRLRVRRGLFRRLAVAFFGVVLILGVAETFAAGVVLGISRSPEGAAMTLVGAAVLIGVASMFLPQINRQHADAELRKLRAMDVA